MKRFIMLCGLPCSGKSTLRAKLVADAEANGQNVFAYSTDDVLHQIAKERNIDYNTAFNEHVKEAQKRADYMLALAFEADYDLVIWDQTNVGVKSRRKKMNRVPSGYSKGIVHVTCDLDVIMDRNAKRQGQVIPEDVIRRMDRDFVAPSYDEGWDEIETVDTTEF